MIPSARVFLLVVIGVMVGAWFGIWVKHDFLLPLVGQFNP